MEGYLAVAVVVLAGALRVAAAMGARRLLARNADLGAAALLEVLVFVGVVLVGSGQPARRGLLRWDLG